MVAAKAVKTSNNDATTRQRGDATMPTMPTTRLTGRAEEDGRLICLGGGGGSYYLHPHRRMGGTAHGFVRPPLHLTASEAMTMAASAGGPAGPPPRLCACRQTRAATHNNDDDDDDDDNDHAGTKEQQRRRPPATQEHQDAPAAGGRQPVTQSSTIAERRAMTKRAVDKSKQQPTIAC